MGPIKEEKTECMCVCALHDECDVFCVAGVCSSGGCGAGRRSSSQDDDGDAGRARVVFGTTGDDPDPQVRQRHGHQQSIITDIFNFWKIPVASRKLAVASRME